MGASVWASCFGNFYDRIKQVILYAAFEGKLLIIV